MYHKGTTLMVMISNYCFLSKFLSHENKLKCTIFYFTKNKRMCLKLRNFFVGEGVKQSQDLNLFCPCSYYEMFVFQNSVETGYTEKSTVEEARKDIEARYRQELNRKLDEVNNYLEEQARTRQRLDTSREEQESKLRQDKKKFEVSLNLVCVPFSIKVHELVECLGIVWLIVN